MYNFHGAGSRFFGVIVWLISGFCLGDSCLVWFCLGLCFHVGRGIVCLSLFGGSLVFGFSSFAWFCLPLLICLGGFVCVVWAVLLVVIWFVWLGVFWGVFYCLLFWGFCLFSLLLLWCSFQVAPGEVELLATISSLKERDALQIRAAAQGDSSGVSLGCASLHTHTHGLLGVDLLVSPQARACLETPFKAGFEAKCLRFTKHWWLLV